MSRRRCNTCGQGVGPRANSCPACGGEIRVTISEPGHGTIEYILRKTPPRDPRKGNEQTPTPPRTNPTETALQMGNRSVANQPTLTDQLPPQEDHHAPGHRYPH